MSPVFLVALAAVAIVITHPAQALQFRDYDPVRHNRFTGYPSAPVPNPSFMHAAVDLTGVAHTTSDSRKGLTLMAPGYMVCARHFAVPVNSVIRFVTPTGVVVERTLAANIAILNGSGQATDLLLCKLSAPIDPSTGIQFHPYLNLPTEASYIGQDLIVLGMTARGGIGSIAAIADFSSPPGSGGTTINETRTMEFVYTDTDLFGSDDDVYAQVGDSGSPTFVETGGRAAIVSTHTAISTVTFAGTTTTTTLGSFVPHYADELNAAMGVDGYHMTEATPASVALNVSRQVSPGVLRAGYPFGISTTIQNTDPQDDVNNLQLVQSLPAGAMVGSTAGTLWVPQSEVGGASARRGGIDAASSSTVSVEVTVPQPGEYSSALTLNYDEGAEVTGSLGFTVIESYLSWSEGLAVAGVADDPDGDGAPNLLEYSSGSDPADGADTREPSASFLVVTGDKTRAQITFVRRTDAAQRALTYTLESSSTLAGGSWGDATAEITATEVTPLTSGFETVSLEVPTGEDRRFFRIRIDLNE